MSDNPPGPTATALDRAFTHPRTVIVKTFFKNPVVAALTSLKFTAALLIVFAVAIAKATFIENDWGAEGARSLVYNAKWFELVLGLFCLNLILVFIQRMPYKPRQTGAVIVHISMIVILVSAGITRWFGYEGIMHIREGSSADFIWSREPHVQLTVGDDFASYPVRLFRPGEVTSKSLDMSGASWTVAVENYWPHYEESWRASDSGPAALKLAVVGNDGMETSLLVEGETGRTRGVPYRLVRGDAPPEGGEGLVFALADDGTVRLRTDAALDRTDMGSDEVDATWEAGEVLEVEMDALYRTPDSWISFVMRESFDHVASTPGLSSDERAPAAALLSVVSPDGARAETVVTKDADRATAVDVGGTTAWVKLAAIRIPVPYSIALDDFLLLNYPGSRNPASYESHVRLYDEAQGIQGRPVRIYMNHPLTHRGFKHFQSSYDNDEQGTILSVNYDPGKIPTYIGYFLISLGFVLIFARDLIWPKKDMTEGAGRDA